MSPVERIELLLSLTTKIEGWLDEEVTEGWKIPHFPDWLAHLMAGAAMHVVDVVIATETSMDEHGLLAEDGDGVKVA